MIGGAKNWLSLAATPLEVVTAIGPVRTRAGAVAAITDSETTPNAPATPPNPTLVAPVNALPLIATAVPGPPICGVKEEITGTGPGAPCQLIVRRSSGDVRIGLLFRSAGWNTWIWRSVMPTGTEHPAQAPRPVEPPRSTLTLNA